MQIRRAGEPVAYLAGPEFAGLLAKLSETWRNREPPFTQDALDRWLDEVLAGVDVAELMSADSEADGERLASTVLHK